VFLEQDIKLHSLDQALIFGCAGENIRMLKDALGICG